MSIRQLARHVLPQSVRRRLRRLKDGIDDAVGRRLPIQQKFARVYRQNEWGAPSEGDFYSGAGSDDAVTKRYVEFVTNLIAKEHIRTVLDIGCGDFRVGRQLIAAAPNITYVGVDIVPDLITHHQRTYANNRVQFHCANIVSDSLPPADVVLIRQVLQHLSSHNIHRVLRKVAAYKWVVASDGCPPDEQPHSNDDIVDGPNVRPRGLFLECAPFSVPGSCVLTTQVFYPDGRRMQDIRTLLFSPNAMSR